MVTSVYNLFSCTPWQTTFVLKRKKKVELHKTTGKMRPFRARHYLYEMVEDTNVRKKDPVKVILTKPVEGKSALCDILVGLYRIHLDYEIHVVSENDDWFIIFLIFLWLGLHGFM